MPCCPTHEGGKQNTIGVIKGTNAKLPHHRGHVPTYPMRNKMSLVQHVIKRQGCGCNNWGQQKLKCKDSKTFNEKTQVQADEGEVQIKEGIKLGWSHGFGLYELDA